MDVVIVGGGAAGVISASTLLRRGRAGDRIHLVERSSEIGSGVAYSTRVPVHRVNVPANRMSARPDYPDHFVRYLEAHGLGSRFTYASRRVYGDYLRATLAAAAAASEAEYLGYTDEVVSVRSGSGGPLRVSLASGGRIDTDHVILAVGHGRFSVPVEPGPGVVTQPWGTDLEAVVAVHRAQDRPIVVVGTGLSAADVIAELDLYGCRNITAISQRGRFPEAQLPEPEPPLRYEDVQHLADVTTAVEVIRQSRLLFQRFADVDWRRVVDALRYVIPEAWPNIPDREREKLFRRILLIWEQHRNRMPPETARTLQRLLDDKRLRLVSGRVHGFSNGELMVRRFGDERTLFAELVICCTGPSRFAGKMGETLIDQLLEEDYAGPGRTGIGLDTDLEGRVTGPVSRRLWAIGSVRRGSNWESFNITEIRTQAEVVASKIVEERESIGARFR